MTVVRLVAPLLRLFAPNVNFQELVDTVRGSFLRECSFTEEAKNQEKFRNLFSSDPSIQIPRVYREFSSDRVLVSEFVAARHYLCGDVSQSRYSVAGRRHDAHHTIPIAELGAY